MKVELRTIVNLSNSAMRQKSTTPLFLFVDKTNLTMKQLQKVTRLLLDPQSSPYSLRPEVMEMITILSNAQHIENQIEEDISSGETLTPNGLAISPTMAQMCADDYVRTILFIRGLHDAITDHRKQYPNHPTLVFYVGCGPYATLAVGLMTLFPPSEVTFTLLDVHHVSIESVKSILATLGLTKSVESFETTDASSYQIPPDKMPDIILMEIMQVCLQSEPQVAIARHLLKQVPQAIMLPEEIRIDLTLANLSKEFDLGNTGDQKRSRDRIAIAPIFALNRENIELWSNNSSKVLLAASIQLPDTIEKQYELMLFTIVCVYKKHILKDYDSGLTCPKPLVTEDICKAGDTIHFNYVLGDNPRLIAKVETNKNQ